MQGCPSTILDQYSIHIELPFSGHTVRDHVQDRDLVLEVQDEEQNQGNAGLGQRSGEPEGHDHGREDPDLVIERPVIVEIVEDHGAGIETGGGKWLY